MTEEQGGKVEMPTPFAVVEIKIKPNDIWAKDEIVEWIFKKCGLTTERDAKRFNDKCDRIRQSIRESV